MYDSKIKSTLFFILFLLITTANADTIILKNGLKLNGSYKGGTEKVIKFETSGAVQEIAVSEVKSITFITQQAAKAAKASQGTAQLASQPANTSKMTASAGALPSALNTVNEIPAGTKIMIKTKEAISTAQHKNGAVVEGALELDLVINGTKVAPKGTIVYGTVLESIGGRRIGKQRIVIQFDHIVINGKKVAIETDPVGAEGGRGGAAKMVGAGALIGSASGNAGKGAAIGAGVALLAGGKHIQIPAGTKVDLTIKNSVKIK